MNRINTPFGQVSVRSFEEPDGIRQYELDKELAEHTRYKSLYTKIESLEKDAASPDAKVVLAITDDDRIVGYSSIVYPEAGERWRQMGPGLMMEVKAIETCRGWRGLGIAGKILDAILDSPDIEDKISYMVGYSWTWDLEYTGLTASDYRQILVKLFGSRGFDEYETNEPNIKLQIENILMCRIGKNISEDVIEKFKWLRFGISP